MAIFNCYVKLPEGTPEPSQNPKMFHHSYQFPLQLRTRQVAVLLGGWCTTLPERPQIPIVAMGQWELTKIHQNHQYLHMGFDTIYRLSWPTFWMRFRFSMDWVYSDEMQLHAVHLSCAWSSTQLHGNLRLCFVRTKVVQVPALPIWNWG